MPPTSGNNIFMSGDCYIIDSDGTKHEMGVVKELNCENYDTTTMWTTTLKYTTEFSFEMNLSKMKFKQYVEFVKLFGVDYNELKFRYKVEFILCYIIDVKLKNFKR